MDKIELEYTEAEIYEQYQNVIAPFIIELETRDTEYPIEIFNEIRSIFTHLSRYKIQGNEKELISAERHVKRAILDCYKYLCVAIAERLNSFRTEYNGVHLNLADHGQFLPTFNQLETEAKKAFYEAKKAEIKNEIPEDDIYYLFENAYAKYSTVDEYLDSSHDAILFASSHTKTSDFINTTSITVTIISIIFGIVSFFS
jgi:hypothetical protein